MGDMKTVAVIPARMGSSRFPGKPLAKILGKPMIEHVYRGVVECAALDEVVVATCDDEICDCVEGFGGRVVMTSDRHTRASERVAEANEEIGADVVVMVQGDEPMIKPAMLDAALSGLRDDPEVGCVNLYKRITEEREFRNPNCIKVVIDQRGNALYFSREPIPTTHVGGFTSIEAYKQVCIMPFTREALARFAALPETPLERAESIDMMRFLEHGMAVRMIETDVDSHAVDTPEDLVLVERMMG